ncbi:LemA family protein [Methanosarcina horonobensis]|uniref:LemA family protein n=1 Tax=Methanosarcina horonobensis TaxID=418008 RepID=UPI000A8CBFF8|nr:LemA family protein [Methanosarcina horonobensis]
MSAQNVNETAEASNYLSSTLKSLFAVAENYPELKANQNFIQLQKDLLETENKIAYSRQFYNDTVMKYNISIQTIPKNIVASLMGFTKKKTYSKPCRQKGKLLRLTSDIMCCKRRARRKQKFEKKKFLMQLILLCLYMDRVLAASFF